MRPAVAYIRVSTQRQGRSGLGLEAQQAAIARFAEAEAFELLETFTETESGPTMIGHSSTRRSSAPARPRHRSSAPSSTG